MVCALFALALRAHFVEILPRDAIGFSETLLGWPVVAASCAAIVVAFIGLKMHLGPLQYLGKISYGLYVYHLLCIKIAERLLSNDSGALHMVLRLLLSLGITILFAAASYAILEKPF
jgi:peptidoglycan/LPS O-acetylase OafA/YrhL